MLSYYQIATANFDKEQKKVRSKALNNNKTVTNSDLKFYLTTPMSFRDSIISHNFVNGAYQEKVKKYDVKTAKTNDIKNIYKNYLEQKDKNAIT